VLSPNHALTLTMRGANPQETYGLFLFLSFLFWFVFWFVFVFVFVFACFLCVSRADTARTCIAGPLSVSLVDSAVRPIVYEEVDDAVAIFQTELAKNRPKVKLDSSYADVEVGGYFAV
jgi:hypothetical protein